MQYDDIIINPRWRTAASMKIVMSAYLIALWRNLVHCIR